MDADIKQLTDQLYFITHKPEMSGFSEFITTWLYKGTPTFIVDVGPSATASQLINALNKLGIDHLDYILLTHIHLDHAGGIGEIAAHFASTPIICHSAGIPHLIDPAKLWEGTVKTLGDLGRAYGPLTPVPENRFIEAESFVSDTIQPIVTLGHAPHHISYQLKDYLFAGEPGGVFIPQPDGSCYLRPATPPRFFLETSLKSIDILMEKTFTYFCYGHYGMSSDPKEMLMQHRDQLLRWDDIIKEEFERFDQDDFYPACLKRLIKEDPFLLPLTHMPEDVRQREEFFLTNSIKGFALSLKAAAKP